MAYTAVTTAEVQVGKPEKQSLWQKVKDNFDYLFGVSEPPEGVVVNGSFEIDSDSDGVPDSWIRSLYPGGAGAFETTSPAHGAKAYKFTHPGGASNGGGYLESEYMGVTALTTYFLEYVTWASAAGMKNIVRVRYFTAAKVYISETDLYSSTSNPASATKYISQFTPPATARFYKTRVIGGYTDTDVAGIAYFDDVEMGEVTNQLKLKTSQGSSQVTNADVQATTVESATVTLPGGEYGFIPQLATSGGAASSDGFRWAEVNHDKAPLAVSAATSWVYFGYDMNGDRDTAGVMTVTMYQRYITASGEVYWVFILRDILTKKILPIWENPDHPCMGNGNDPDEVQHPFLDYDPAKHEIIVINPSQEQLAEIDGKRQWKNGAAKKGICQVITEEYEIDEASRPSWPDNFVTVGLNKERTAPVKMRIPKPGFVEARRIKIKGSSE